MTCGQRLPNRLPYVCSVLASVVLLSRSALSAHDSVMLSAKHMPKSPKGQRRPADVVSNAVHVMKIATGEIKETLTDDGKNAAAVALGRMGGMARAKSLSARKRRAIAKTAAASRWKR